MLVINPQSKVERIGFVSPRLRLASPSGTRRFVASLRKTADSSLPTSSHPFPVELPLPFLVLCHSGCGLAKSGSWRSQGRSQALMLLIHPDSFWPRVTCKARPPAGWDPGPESEPQILKGVQSLYGQSDAWLSGHAL